MAQEEINKHDIMLSEILEDKKTIVKFLDSVFGFLLRKTDFYHEMIKPGDFGFPPGITEELVLSSLRRFDPKYNKNLKPTLTITNKEEVSTSNKDRKDLSINYLKNTQKDKMLENNKELHFHPNEYYNGAKFDTYCWSQTINDLEIHLRLPEHIKLAKHLEVEILSDLIKIKEKSKNNIILEGKLYSKCKYKDAIWSIVGGKLQINLDKASEIWWEKLFIKESIIDLSKIDCSRDISELSEDVHTVIDKIQWDEKQKMLGLPTSDEEKNLKILHKAWDLDGSPFKGQPFDPSIVKFN